MRLPIDQPTVSVVAAQTPRLKQLFADAFGSDLLADLSLRLDTLSRRSKRHRDAMAWTRLALSCDGRSS